VAAVLPLSPIKTLADSECRISIIGVIVPLRSRADWRQEWEAELRYREELLTEWDNLNWKTKLDLYGSAWARSGMRYCYNHEDWRKKCFKTCGSACECC